MRLRPRQALVWTALLGAGAGAGHIGYRVLVRQSGPPRGNDFPPVEPLSPLARDIGEVCVGADAVEEFAYLNTGGEPLRVASVVVNCGCTRYEVVPFEVQPGATGVIRLITEFRDPVGYERRSRISAEVAFVGYARRIRFQFDALVVRDLPTVVDFGRVLPDGTPQTATFLARPCEGPVDIARTTCDDPSVTARLIEDSTEGAQQRIEVRLNPPGEPGLFVRELRLHSAQDDRPARVVPIRATVAARIEADPGSLLLGNVEGGQTYSYGLRLASTVSQSFTIERITASVEGLRCTWNPAEARPTAYLLQARLDAPRLHGALSGTMEITTSDPACPTVIVPVYGVCNGERDVGP